MTGRRAVFADQSVADFRIAQSLLLEFACDDRAIHAGCAASRMIILIATVQALVSDTVAVAKTRQLRESLRNLLRHLISLPYLSRKLFRRQRRLQAGEGRRLGEMGRDRTLKGRGGSLRLILRGVVTLNLITG